MAGHSRIQEQWGAMREGLAFAWEYIAVNT